MPEIKRVRRGAEIAPLNEDGLPVDLGPLAGRDVSKPRRIGGKVLAKIDGYPGYLLFESVQDYETAIVRTFYRRG